MLLKAITLFLISLCALVLSSARGNELVIYTEQFPPYNFLKNEEIQGINIDIVKRACFHAQISCRFEIYPWNRAVSLTKRRHNAGLVSTSRTPSREEQFLWVGPLVASTTCFYTLAENQSVQINKNSDLKNYTISLQRGDVYEDLLTSFGMSKTTNYVYHANKFDYVSAFRAGKLDLFLASVITLPSHLEHLSMTVDDIKPVYVIDNPSLGGNYLALNKNVGPNVVERLQREVAKLMQPTELFPFKARYLGHGEATRLASDSLESKCLPQDS